MKPPGVFITPGDSINLVHLTRGRLDGRRRGAGAIACIVKEEFAPSLFYLKGQS